MREDVLRGLAARASSDRAFLSDLRRDPEAVLAVHDYALTEEELAMVLDLRLRTAALGGGLKSHTGSPPGRKRALGR